MFILKSRSPRRIEILRNLGIELQVNPSDIDERQFDNELPLDYLYRIVKSKLGDVSHIKNPDLHLACDTIVVYENKILHKPMDLQEAFQILSVLNGKEHSVYSGCILSSREESDYFFEESRIQFKQWSEEQILDYIQRSHPLDKAGAYGIQDTKGPVLHWKGSYTNVLGFPIRGFIQRWEKWISAWS